MNPRYVFVTGGVVSALGKGIVAASLGSILQHKGINASYLKLDPYLNIDAGTMSPFQHGEVFVTSDGAETDLDLGHYERFTNQYLGKKNNITTGQIYSNVLEKERRGVFLGKTVQVIPHISEEIKECIKGATTPETQVLIIEIGGTVGDIESLPFLETARQIRNELKKERVAFIHVTLVPFIETAGELKSKPTQHSVKELLSLGIQPDILICRSTKNITEEIRSKLALFCNLSVETILSLPDVDTIYKCPILLNDQQLGELLEHQFRLVSTPAKMENWTTFLQAETSARTKKSVHIGLIGKYGLEDAYKSLYEALRHAAVKEQIQIDLSFLDADTLTKSPKFYENIEFCQLDGILIPGGFGYRGIESMIQVITQTRIQKIPFLGICLGMQCALLEIARNKCDLAQANSTEFDSETDYKIFDKLQSLFGVEYMGGTMRLGNHTCQLSLGTLTHRIYNQLEIVERHRHRYEFNTIYRSLLEKNGVCFSAWSIDTKLAEMIELDHQEHPWFVGCQFHPEYRSTPFAPHPLFLSFLKASQAYKEKNKS